jgi:hypothetical protein
VYFIGGIDIEPGKLDVQIREECGGEGRRADEILSTNNNDGQGRVLWGVRGPVSWGLGGPGEIGMVVLGNS